MKNKAIKFVLGTIVVVPFAAPLTVYAQDGLHGTVEAGLINTDLDPSPSAKFGEYTGIDESGTDLFANFDVDWQKGTWYLDATGRGLGLDNRALNAEIGQYNGARLFLRHAQIPKLVSDNAASPFSNAGSDVLTLAGGYTVKASNANATDTDADGVADGLVGVDIGWERKANGIALVVPLAERWQIGFSYDRETQEGVGVTSGALGGVTNLPRPIDFVTDILRGSVGYQGERGQWSLEYMLSTFKNNDPTLTWDNPFTTPATDGLLALEPDNNHQRISLTGGFDVNENTRLTGLVEIGRMSQDETLAAYTINPASSVTTALPRDSAEAEINTKHAQLRLSLRPRQQLAMNAGVRYYETDNNTPSDTFLRVITDNGNQVAQNTSFAANNMPYDSKTLEYRLDGTYAFKPGTSLRLAAERENVDRDHRARSETTEDILSARFQTRFVRIAQLTVGYSDSRRTGDDYDVTSLFAEQHTPEYVATIADSTKHFDNHPELRQFDIADRNRKHINAGFSLSPRTDLTLSLLASQRKDDYGDSDLGLADDNRDSLTLDVSYAPVEGFSAYGFATKENLTRQANGHWFTSTTATDSGTLQTDNIDRRWSVDHDEDVLTIGLGGKLKLLDNKLGLRLDAVQMKGETDLEFGAGSMITSNAPYIDGPYDVPDLTSERLTLNLAGDYAVTEAFTVTLGYLYEQFKNEDWFTDNLEAGTTAADAILLLTGPTEDYTARQIYASVTYRW